MSGAQRRTAQRQATTNRTHVTPTGVRWRHPRHVSPHGRDSSLSRMQMPTGISPRLFATRFHHRRKPRSQSRVQRRPVEWRRRRTTFKLLRAADRATSRRKVIAHRGTRTDGHRWSECLASELAPRYVARKIIWRRRTKRRRRTFFRAEVVGAAVVKGRGTAARRGKVSSDQQSGQARGCACPRLAFASNSSHRLQTPRPDRKSSAAK